MKYLVSEYSATGEGSSVYVMLSPSSVHNPKDRFKDVFGAWFAAGVEEIEESVFWDKYAHLLPEYVAKMLNRGGGNFSYYSSFHFNLS